MAGGGFLPMKLKRKDLDQVNDDFSDFSLSSPARKIRRLVQSLTFSCFVFGIVYCFFFFNETRCLKI